MEVKLLTTPEHLNAMEHNAAYAMLTCHANTERLKQEPAQNFIEKAIKMQHDSILEHITLTYEVNDLSRACLQELARHRHISLSVESTRHTLKQKAQNGELKIFIPDDTPVELLNFIQQNMKVFSESVEKSPDLLKLFSELSNDTLKYFFPEYICTNLVLTANVRELRHIIELRTAPAALKEFQDLAREFVNMLPSRFKYLLEDCVYVDKK